MPTRADMDRPATVTAALLGVVLIAVSAPFLASSGASASTYAISWTQERYALNNQVAGSANADTSVAIAVEGRHPSNATITFNPCTDAAQPPLQQPATITWSLKADSTVLKENQQASCASPGPFTVPLHPHPDIGSAEGDNATAAAASAEAYSGLTTYTLTFRWSRPAGATGPLPLPPPQFSATGTLEVKTWHAVANLPPEAGK
jgi:hypothetical protein